VTATATARTLAIVTGASIGHEIALALASCG
jgi:hypothetical protein